MDSIVELAHSAHAIFVIIAGIVSFIIWKRVGFKVPRYLHIIAFLSACVGLFLSYLGHVTGADQEHKTAWLIIGFPIATYFIFGFFGGGHVMAERDKHR